MPHIGPQRPVAIDPAWAKSRSEQGDPSPRRVQIISPCFNAPADLRRLYEDLAALDLRLDDGSTLAITLLVIDNASNEPLERIEPPAGLSVRVVRLARNTGGSGGYNAGMAMALQAWHAAETPAEFFWLLDSDARPERSALTGLVHAMDTHRHMVIIGSSIASPITGDIFEIGGRLDRVFGQFRPQYSGIEPPPARTSEVVYTAACSCLVRPGAIDHAGLFPDVFLNGDDVEWCIRVAQETGGRIGATTDSVVHHPQLKFGVTLARYYIARNAFGPIDALRLGARVRLFRALREIPRALAQVMIGRDDLAELHIRGLEDAAAGRLFGAGAKDELTIDRFGPMRELGETLKPVLAHARGTRVWLHPKVRLDEGVAEEVEKQLRTLGLDVPAIPRGDYILEQEHFFTGLAGGVLRFLVGPRHPIAIVPVRGRPNAWCRGCVQIEVAPEEQIVRRVRRRHMLASAITRTLRGVRASVQLMLRPPARSASERLTDPRECLAALELDTTAANQTLPRQTHAVR